MASITEWHDGALASTHQYAAGIADDAWDAPTPCEGWNVRDLLNHIVSGNLWAAELAAGKSIEEVGDRLDGDVLGDEPVAAYDRSAAAAAEVFKRPGALDEPAAVSYGPVPNSVYCGHRFVDVLVHGWDLAKATGQPLDLPPELVRGALSVVEPQRDTLVASGAFKGGVETPEGADDQTRLLAWLGRQA